MTSAPALEWQQQFDACIAAYFKARMGDLVELLGYQSRWSRSQRSRSSQSNA